MGICNLLDACKIAIGGDQICICECLQRAWNRVRWPRSRNLWLRSRHSWFGEWLTRRFCKCYFYRQTYLICGNGYSARVWGYPVCVYCVWKSASVYLIVVRFLTRRNCYDFYWLQFLMIFRLSKRRVFGTKNSRLNLIKINYEIINSTAVRFFVAQNFWHLGLLPVKWQHPPHAKINKEKSNLPFYRSLPRFL